MSDLNENYSKVQPKKLKRGSYVWIPSEKRYGYVVGKRWDTIDREETGFAWWYHVPSCAPGIPVEWYQREQLEFIRRD